MPARKPEEQRDRVAALYRTGLTLRQVARRENMHIETVRTICRQKGVALRPPGGLNTSHNRNK